MHGNGTYLHSFFISLHVGKFLLSIFLYSHSFLVSLSSTFSSILLTSNLLQQNSINVNSFMLSIPFSTILFLEFYFFLQTFTSILLTSNFLLKNFIPFFEVFRNNCWYTKLLGYWILILILSQWKLRSLTTPGKWLMCSLIN